MIKQGYRDPDPCTQVLTDVSKMIAAKQHKGCKISIMIDANESSGKRDPNGVSSLKSTVYTMYTKPKTRLGSKTRINFMVATEGILPYIRAAAFRSLYKVVVSDHILLWADIDMKVYFRGEGPSITQPQGREFSLDNIELGEIFLS